MTDRELMQQALDALELVTDLTNHDDEVYAAIEALRARLAQPEQEPLWIRNEEGKLELHASPQREWIGLTHEQIQKIEMSVSSKLSTIYLAEAQLKGKNAL